MLHVNLGFVGGGSLMEYNAEKHTFLCGKCGPGPNKWKNAFSAVYVNKETGDVYCVCHRDHKIGHCDMIPEWRYHD